VTTLPVYLNFSMSKYVLLKLTPKIDLVSAGGSGIHRPVGGTKSKSGKHLAPGEEYKAKVSPANCCHVMSNEVVGLFNPYDCVSH